MKYTTVITDRDPTLEGCKTHMTFPQTCSLLDAKSDARHYAEAHCGFGSVYDSYGESVYEANFTEKE